MTRTIEAHLTKDEGWWAVQVRGLPPNVVAYTQGRSVREAKNMARDLAASVLDEPPESIEVEVFYPDPMDALRRSVAEARAQREASAAAEQEAVRRAARELLDQGLTVRDAGSILGLSAQRISQLTRGHRAA